MTTTPEPPPAHDDESGATGATGATGASSSAAPTGASSPTGATGSGGPAGPTAATAAGDDTPDDRFDRRIALGVVAALAVLGTIGPFSWHLLSNTLTGSSQGSGGIAAIAAGGGGAGSNGAAAVIVATTSSPSANPTTTVTSAATAASASCSAALSGSKTGSGTATTVDAWVVKAAPSIGTLRTDSATLKAVVVRQDPAAVPAAAKALCDNVGIASQLDANPDTVDATGWQAALSAYVAAATDALAGANHPAYFQAAQAQLAQGEQELDVLTAHITATAHQ